MTASDALGGLQSVHVFILPIEDEGVVHAGLVSHFAVRWPAALP
jgi:hypothetical protein